MVLIGSLLQKFKREAERVFITTLYLVKWEKERERERHR